MEELIKLVSSKTGIAEDQAKTAVNTVLDFLKEKLPAPIAAHVDGAVNAAGGSINDITSGIGNLFG